MQDPNSIVLFVVGLAAGVFSGMFGIGGGVIIVPVLLLFFSATFTEPTQAIATSLAALLLPVGVFAVASYHRKKLLDMRSALLIAIGLLITAVVGAKIALNLPADTLKQVYGVFLVYMGWRFAEPRRAYAEYRAVDDVKSKEQPQGVSFIPWYVALGIGLVAGVFSGMFGIGGGAVIVPMLVGLFNYDQKLAVGTSLGALLLPVGLPAVLEYYNAGELNLSLAVPIAFGLAFGALGGAQLALALPSKTVKRLYGVFLLFVGAWFILQPILLPS